MDEQSKLIAKKFAILHEVETSIRLIKLGFGELQNLQLTNDFYFLPFQLLSQGFERLLKSMICIAFFERNGTYPSNEYFRKNLGHDLIKLTNEFLNDYFVSDKPILALDLKFIQEDPELKRLLPIISDFGKMTRYYNFDIITDGAKPGANPIDQWKTYENEVITNNPKLLAKIGDVEASKELYADLSKHILCTFERYMGGLCRQFTLGKMGPHASQLSFFVFDFITLREFGVTDYRKNTTRYQQQPRKRHKRNFIDRFKRNFKSSYKHKVIHKNDHKGEWPFYAETVVIECRDKNWCVVTIEGYDYALNGSAKSRFKLDDAHEAGQAILGKGTGDFISLALELGKS